LSDADSNVFNGVMGIDVKIAFGAHFEVEQPVARDLAEHVIQETDSGLKIVLARTVQIQLYADVCFERFAFAATVSQ
jgi:hypothetical protein